jgi:DNA-binding NarL/FixJ family response regulator
VPVDRRQMTHGAQSRQKATGTVTVVTGLIEPLTDAGLTATLTVDIRVALLAAQLNDDILERTVAHSAPQVVILGDRVQHAFLARLRSGHPKTSIVLLAREPPQLLGTFLLAMGVTCVARSASVETILKAIGFAVRGQPTFAPSTGEQIVPQYLPNTARLTRREIQVLEHLCDGKTNKEMAHALKIGVETVRTYISNVLLKLEVNDRHDLIGKVIRPNPLQ